MTDAGRDALREWIGAPSAPTRLRDDCFMKLHFAADLGVADPAALIASQRAAYLAALADLERVLAGGAEDRVTGLLVEGAALHLEADLRGLDRCEAELAAWDGPDVATLPSVALLALALPAALAVAVAVSALAARQARAIDPVRALRAE